MYTAPRRSHFRNRLHPSPMESTCGEDRRRYNAVYMGQSPAHTRPPESLSCSSMLAEVSPTSETKRPRAEADLRYAGSALFVPKQAEVGKDLSIISQIRYVGGVGMRRVSNHVRSQKSMHPPRFWFGATAEVAQKKNFPHVNRSIGHALPRHAA
jgi:hypothetical protein